VTTLSEIFYRTGKFFYSYAKNCVSSVTKTFLLQGVSKWNLTRPNAISRQPTEIFLSTFHDSKGNFFCNFRKLSTFK